MLTNKLFELREILDQTDEYKAYKSAKQNALDDITLQILFGEFNQLKETEARFGSAALSTESRNRLQQLKQTIFSNVQYQQLQKAEKELNRLRQEIATELFSALDSSIVVEGNLRTGGKHKCG